MRIAGEVFIPVETPTVWAGWQTFGSPAAGLAANQYEMALKPGITGLWQVDGRSRVTFNEMVRMDLRYIRDCSPWLDLRILLKTVLVVIRCDGAV